MVHRLGSPMSRRQLLVATGTGAAAAFLSGCGGGTQRGGGSSQGGQGGPQHGGVYISAIPSDISTTFDIHGGVDVAWENFLHPLHSRLVSFNSGPDMQASLEVVPDLAHEWEISEDGLTYTFHLRDNVLWHDIEPVSGRPLTSDDVLATFENIIDRSAAGAWMFDQVADMQAPDDHTVVIELSTPYAPLIMYMAKFETSIVPREFTEGAYDIETQVIGTGPFMLESYQRGEQMIMVRHPEYFLDGRPYLDERRILVVTDNTAAGAALVSGRTMSGLIPEGAGERERFAAVEGIREVEGAPETAVALWMNEQRAPFDDLRVRRAVSMALDWEGQAQTLYPDRWLLSSAVPPMGGDYALPPEEIKKVRPFDPEQARSLLAEAGYPDGFDTSMVVMSVSSHDVPGAEYMIHDLREIGINVELQPVDLATGGERFDNRDFDMARRSKRVELPDTYLNDFMPGARLNYSNVDDERLAEMIVQTRSVTDEQERIRQFHDIQRYIETEVASAIYGYTRWAYMGIWEQVKDYHPNIHGSSLTWTNVWLDE